MFDWMTHVKSTQHKKLAPNSLRFTACTACTANLISSDYGRPIRANFINVSNVLGNLGRSVEKVVRYLGNPCPFLVYDFALIIHILSTKAYLFINCKQIFGFVSRHHASIVCAKINPVSEVNRL
jgi:hypothetical protein